MHSSKLKKQAIRILLSSKLKEGKLENDNSYFKERSKRVKIIRRRSNFNLFVFHFSSSIMKKIRNIFLKFLVERKTFIESYLGKVYKN